MFKRIFQLFVVALYTSAIACGQDNNPLINSGKIIGLAAHYSDSFLFDKALKVLKSIDISDTNYTLSLELQANNYLMNKEYDKAISLAVYGLEKPSQYTQKFNLIQGIAYNYKGNPDSALMIYDTLLKKYPYNYLIYYELGITYRDAKNYLKAIQSFQRSVQLNPFYPSGHLALGKIMASMGFYTRAMLCYETYLTLEPGTSKSNDQLIFLNDFVNNALGTEAEKIEPVIDNSLFKDIDQLIQSQIALNKNYKLKVGFDVPVTRQTQLLFESIEYKPNTGDFWMDHYVPFFRTVIENNDLENFIYLIVRTADNKDVKKQLGKRGKSIAKMRGILTNELLEINDNLTISTNGEEQKVEYSLDGNGNIKSLGSRSGDGRNKTGLWQYFYGNGEISSEGNYDEMGKPEGEWKSYSKDGYLTFLQNYSDGQLEGLYSSYYKNGNLKFKVKYEKGRIIDSVVYYYDCGAISAIVPIVNNKRNGLVRKFYKNGSLSKEYSVVNDSMSGIETGYYANGNPKWKYFYDADKLNGMAFDYYRNGTLSFSGNYFNGELSGSFVRQYDDGKVKESGNYNKGLYFGKIQEFDEKGKISKSTVYDESGLRTGDEQLFSNGKRTSVYVYDKDKLKSIKFFDQMGNEFGNQNFSGVMQALKGFSPDGQLLYEGFVKNGLQEGKWIYYYNNHKIQAIKYFSEGKMNGSYKGFYADGSLSDEATYNDNRLNGYYKHYNVSDILTSEGWYINGKREGKWLNYANDGSLLSAVNFLKGDINGLYESFAPDSKLQYSSVFEDGTKVSMDQYDTSGNVFSHSTFNGTSDLIIYFPDRTIRSKCNYECNQYNSQYASYYKNGQLEVESNYVNDEREGLYTQYYRNGIIAAQGNFEEGQSSGIWKYYDYSGNLDQEVFKKYDEANGPVKKYYDNGKIRCLATYKNDEYIDTARYFAPNGELMFGLVFGNDGLLLSYQYPENGILISKKINTADSGKIITFYNGGKESSELSYLFGKLNGLQVLFYPDGNKYKVYNTRMGKFNGNFKEYYENGNLKEDVNYIVAQLHGTCKYYRQDGTMERIENYLGNSEHGDFIYFDQNGIQIKVEKYWGGLDIN